MAIIKLGQLMNSNITIEKISVDFKEINELDVENAKVKIVPVLYQDTEKIVPGVFLTDGNGIIPGRRPFPTCPPKCNITDIKQLIPNILGESALPSIVFSLKEIKQVIGSNRGQLVTVELLPSCPMLGFVKLLLNDNMVDYSDRELEIVIPG